MKNKFFKDLIYYTVSMHIISFLLNLLSVKDLKEAFKLMLSNSLYLFIGALIVSYIFYVRRKAGY